MSDTAWPFYPLAFLHDAAACLALARQDRLRLNRWGRLQAGSIARLARVVSLPPARPQPRSEAQAPELSLLIGLLLRADLLALAGRRIRLGGAAQVWLANPAVLQLEQLRQVWWFHPLINTRWFRATRRQQPLSGRWRGLVLETTRWVTTLSPYEWAPIQYLYQYIEDRGFSEPNGEGANLPQVRRAMARRTREFVQFVATVALPRLGFVERGEDLETQHLRPTPEGVAWLQAALERDRLAADPPQDTAVERAVLSPADPFPVDERAGVNVTRTAASTTDPAVEVRLGLAAPVRCTFHLHHVGQLLSPSPPRHYLLTQDSLRRAAGWGYAVTDVILMLARFSAAPLPPEVRALLQAWRQEIVTLSYQAGYRLDLGTPAILRALRRREPFRRRTAPLADRRSVWLARSAAKGLFRYLRRQGYAIQDRTPARDETAAPATPFRDPWPQTSWLVLLRTYERLRQRVPGLAALRVQELAQAIEAALSIEQRAAAARLVASHAKLLEEVLRMEEEGDAGEVQDGTADTVAEGRPTEGQQAAELRRRVAAAIASDTSLTIDYVDREGQVTRRRIQPLYLQDRWGQTYLIAFCQLRQDERMFRLDRIVAVADVA
jgi:hypothetical protein